MKRRTLLALAGFAALPASAQAMKRVGFLIAGDPEPAWTYFKKSMAALGHIEGSNVDFVYRPGGTDEARLAALAAELAGLKVDVLVAALLPAIVAARKATATIPIVFFAGAPELAGIDNLARPGGNLTGVFSPSATLAGKTVQIFKEIKPGARRIGVLLNAQDPFRIPLLKGIEPVAQTDGIELVVSYVKSHDELEPTVAAMAQRSVDAVFFQPTLGLAELADLALKYRLPALSFRREFVEKGGLLSCGADLIANYRTLSDYVDKVLKGTAPSSLPVQQASRFEIVVNQQTAGKLGLSLSPQFLARVDEAIE